MPTIDTAILRDWQRAGRAAERLTRLGYTEVYHYVGGKRAWKAEGLSLEP